MYRTWYSQRPRARDSVLRKCNCMGWNSVFLGGIIGRARAKGQELGLG